MGCRQSAKVVTLEEKYEKLHVQEEVSDAFRILNIDKKRGESYYRVFVDMDADGGGDVDVDEFHEYMEILRTPFSDMAFFSLDQDDNSGLGFVEVVSGVWSICTANESVLVSLAFSLYDADGSGVLDLVDLCFAGNLLINLPGGVHFPFENDL
jgi:Ca2+-binding EF-hand superfamily protein